MSKEKYLTLLKKHRDLYLEHLKRQKYKEATVQLYRRTVDKYICEFELSYEQKIPPNITQARSVIPPTLEKITDRPRYSETIMKGFIKHLMKRKVLAKLPKPKIDEDPILIAREKLIGEYANYLTKYRDLKSRSIRGYSSSFRIFMNFKFKNKPANFKLVVRDDLVNFLIDRGKNAPRHKSMSSHVKNFCSFLFWADYVETDFAKQIPSTRLTIKRKLPRHLHDDDIKKIIQATKEHPTRGKRNYAMSLLMGRLGLRADEIVNLKLSDLNCQRMILEIHGKGDYFDEMPITRAIAAALIDYIETDRNGNSKYLFVSYRPPFEKLTDGQTCADMISEACAKTGIQLETSYIGSHVFRHSAAVTLLEKGASIEMISNFLRHRSRSSTAIYARLDINQLRGLARDLPS